MHSRAVGRIAVWVLAVASITINVNPDAVAQFEPFSQVVPELLPPVQQQVINPSEATAPPDPTPAVDPAGPANTHEPNTTDSQLLGFNVMMQGPIHEAFGTPGVPDPALGIRIHAEAPPKPIVEKPPENVLADEGTLWIPGYWAWSDEANKYVWVSGLFRKPPPGRSWIAGYWSEGISGYRWTSGYWSGDQASAETVEPLPVPPSSIDNGPSQPQPGENYFWLPGQWEYADDQYKWRSGYWTMHQEGWVWQPACYMHTPKGFVYVDGYWDALPTQRGQLYAPVDFFDSAIQQPGYVYRPEYLLGTGATVLLHLFTRPGCPHYYYGDFYDASDVRRGYRPWYEVGYRGGPQLGFNSLWLGYYDWNYRRSGIDFAGSMQRYSDLYRNNPHQRPPKRLKTHPSNEKHPVVAHNFPSPKSKHSHHSLDEVINSQVGGKPFKRLVEKSSDNRAISKEPTEQSKASKELSKPSKEQSKPSKELSKPSKEQFSSPSVKPKTDSSTFKPASKAKNDSSSDWKQEKSKGNSAEKSSRSGSKPSGGKGNGKKK
jgi:WXXGXW repeat (2 copies)